MNFRLSCVCAAALLLSACNANLTVKDVAAPPALTEATKFKGEKLEFAKLQFKLQSGEKYGEVSGGYLCVGQRPLNFSGGTQNVTEGPLYGAITTEIRDAGIGVSSQSEEMFASQAKSNVNYVLGAVVSSLDMRLCAAVSGVKGGSYAKVDWQVFSKSENKVVFQTQTEGSWKNETFVSGTESSVLPKTLAIATKNLMQNKEFRAFMSGK